MTQPSTVTGLAWALLRRAWRRIFDSFWYVECDHCRLRFGADAPGLPGRDFDTRKLADTAARDAGWLIEDERDLCPSCRTHAREQEAPAW